MKRADSADSLVRLCQISHVTGCRGCGLSKQQGSLIVDPPNHKLSCPKCRSQRSTDFIKTDFPGLGYSSNLQEAPVQQVLSLLRILPSILTLG